jgi:hypothetical protein
MKHIEFTAQAQDRIDHSRPNFFPPQRRAFVLSFGAPPVFRESRRAPQSQDKAD